MAQAAVDLCRATRYEGAGTVEFIVDAASFEFYFLEINTRLQVEHPVTEMITGLDLVELMIRSASGEKLPLTQESVKRQGWAIETRVYAEDPYRGFLPSTGRLTHYRPPREGMRDGITVRNDTGVSEGSEISVYYDPMIAKLSTHAPTRGEAVGAMAAALDRFEIAGIAHNVPFLAAIMHNERFRQGRLTTGFIAEEFPQGFKGAPLSDGDAPLFVAAAVAAKLMRTQRAGRISGAMNGGAKIGDSFIASVEDRDVAVCDAHFAVGNLRLAIDGKIFETVVDWFPGRPLMILKHANGETAFQVARHAGGYRLVQGGRDLLVSVRSPHAARLAKLMLAKPAPDTSRLLLCPMPGLVTALPVAAGQEVKAGEPLAVVEAMKMENVLSAERDGVIAKILVKKGDNLARDDVIMEFR
jgi:propionyl-CoA carboxylase alpha chain